MCIIERTGSYHSLGAEALKQGDVERAVETLSEGIKTANEDDHHKVRKGCVYVDRRVGSGCKRMHG